MLARILVPLVLSSVPLAQQSLGMFGEFAREEVYVFDADTDAVLGVLPIVGGLTPCYDCAILADLSLGFVVTANFEVWVIDLTTSPPSLATGTNPIPIGSLGLDVVISLDQKYLLVSGGGALSLSIVDIATR